jgi:hypothetical protein
MRTMLPASGRLTEPVRPEITAPTPGSHDRSTPTGSLEESASNLFDAMLAARAAEEQGADSRALHAFYRTLMSGTLLLPVPPDHGEEAKEALAAAVNDDQPVPYRFDVDELAALSNGRVPGTNELLFEETTRSSIRVRLPGSDTRELERTLSASLRETAVEAAYLVETDGDDGRPRLMLGLLGATGTSATVDVPDGTDVVWLEEPLLGQVRAVADPFHRRARGR